MDAIQAEVASMSYAYEPVLYCDLLDDHTTLSKFLTAVGSTTARDQDPDSMIDSQDVDPGCESVEIKKASQMCLQVHRVLKNQKV